MARKKKCPPPGPNMGYLVSFGDTMTALLAFFIVLNSLAEEQTGANLHAGTGSFVKALKSFGVPGIFSSQLSAQPFQLEAPAPLYIVGSDEEDPSKKATGPEEEDDRQRIIDREQEEFQTFLNDVNRWHEISPDRPVNGEVAFDLFAPLGQEQTVAPDELLSAARQIAPVLRRDGYEAEIVVWTTTPSVTAWTRAIEQAHELQKQLADYLRLPNPYVKLKSSGKPWESGTAKRPTVSLIMRQLEAD